MSTKTNIKIVVTKSKRKSFGFMVTKEGVQIRAPILASKEDIFRVYKEHEAWIKEKYQKVLALEEQYKDVQVLSADDLEALFAKAMDYIPKRVQYYAKMLGVTYKGITFRNQKTKWGSCSSLGNLNFNVLLMKTPPEIIDYVIVHELCHRLEMNHSDRFWAHVEAILPDYKQRQAYLKEQSRLLLKMNPNR